MSASAIDGVGAHDLIDVIDTFYRASLSPDRWQLALDKIGQIVPSVALCLYGYDYRANSGVGLIHSGFDPAAVARYSDYYHELNAWAPGFGRSPVGTLLTSDDFLPRDELVKTEYYNDWLRPQGNQITGWGSLLVNDSHRFLAFSTTLRAADEDKLSEPVMRLVARLIPHVDRAFRLARLLSGAELTQGVQAVVEGIGDPTFLLDRTGRIQFGNAAATALTRRRTLLRIARDGRLEFTDQSAELAMEEQLRSIAARTYRGPMTTFTASSDGETACAMLTPFAPGDTGETGLLSEFVARPVAILVIRLTGFDLRHLLRREFGLTEAELEVALSVADGRSAQETADVRGASVMTVRNQLKAIFGKLDVNRQSELVAKLSHLAGTRPSNQVP